MFQIDYTATQNAHGRTIFSQHQQESGMVDDLHKDKTNSLEN